jgi:glutaredoxin 3
MKTLYVYTRNGCGGCNQVKDFLKKLDIVFVELNVDQDQLALEKLYRDGHRFVPQIYADNKLLIAGGWKTVKTMRRDEILDRLK